MSYYENLNILKNYIYGTVYNSYSKTAMNIVEHPAFENALSELYYMSNIENPSVNVLKDSVVVSSVYVSSDKDLTGISNNIALKFSLERVNDELLLVSEKKIITISGPSNIYGEYFINASDIVYGYDESIHATIRKEFYGNKKYKTKSINKELYIPTRHNTNNDIDSIEVENIINCFDDAIYSFEKRSDLSTAIVDYESKRIYTDNNKEYSVIKEEGNSVIYSHYESNYLLADSNMHTSLLCNISYTIKHGEIREKKYYVKAHGEVNEYNYEELKHQVIE